MKPPKPPPGQRVGPGPRLRGHGEGRDALRAAQGGRRLQRPHARQAHHQGCPADRGQR